MMKKRNLRKISIVGIVLGIGVILTGNWFSHQDNVKAMPDKTTFIEKNNDLVENNAIKAKQLTDNTPRVGIFENAVENPSVTSGIGLSYNTVWINTSEIVSKPSEEIIQDIESQLDLTVKSQISGTARVTGISALTEDSLGFVPIDIEIKVGVQVYRPKIDILVVPNGLFNGNEEMNWKNLDLNSTEGIIENQINNSKLGFPERGVTPRNYATGRPPGANTALQTDIGFQVVDENWRGYVFGSGPGIGTGRASTIPLLNDDTLYPTGYTTMDGKMKNEVRIAGLGSPGIGSSGGVNASGKDMKYGYDYISGSRILEDRMFIDKKYFLRNENGKHLKEILVDSKSQVLYVYDLKLSKNLNFLISFSMYNMSNTTKKFALIDHTDTDYRNDSVPIYPLANNEGFSLKPDDKNRLTIKLKKNGEWLSDYQKYKTADFLIYGTKSLFGLDGLGTGHEVEQHADLNKPLISNVDSMFQLGTSAKMVAPGEAIVGAYEIFVGSEVSYMGLEVTTSDSYDVYNDQSTRILKNSYELTKIQTKPTGPSKGNIHINYPNGEDIKIPFVADATQKAVGDFVIELDKLPNNDVGTIKENKIGVLGVIEEADNVFDGLPSNDAFVTVNVYNFGGKGQLQHVLQNSKWTKEAKEMIVDPVALPGHTISYEYENGKLPDTSKLGLQWIDVRMTDNNDKTQSKVIQVPVLVEEGPLSTGLWMNADDMYIVPEDVQGKPTTQIKQIILSESKAYGVDLTTKLSEGIELNVVDTDLTGKPDVNKTYKATITASKSGFTSISKEIKIYFVKDPIINPTLSIAKPEIVLGEKQTYTATFKDESVNPTKLLDVSLGTAALPDFITVDMNSFRIKIGDAEEKVLPTQDVIKVPSGSLMIYLHEIPAGAQVTLTFDFLTSLDAPPPAYDDYNNVVEFGYLLRANRADGKPIPETNWSDFLEFTILEPTSTIEIKYLMEGTNTPIPNEYTESMSGIIGDESDLINIDLDNYVLSKVQYDGVDQPIPTKAFKVKYGAVETITFYYKGVLKIKSAPNTIDFGSKKVSARSEEYDDSTYDQPLVIWDNRLSLTEWKVTLKQSDDMKLSGEVEQRLASALRYKMADEEKILSKDSQEVFRSAHQTSGEYDVSKTWGPNKQGLRLKVPVGMVKQTGTYETTLTWRIEETY